MTTHRRKIYGENKKLKDRLSKINIELACLILDKCLLAPGENNCIKGFFDIFTCCEDPGPEISLRAKKYYNKYTNSVCVQDLLETEKLMDKIRVLKKDKNTIKMRLEKHGSKYEFG